MNTEHTPGPWKPAGPLSTHIIDSRGIMVADAPHFREMTRKEGFANRDLIAAAPDLLEALKDILSGWRYIRQDPTHLSIYGVGWDRAQEAAEAAIAKAEGKA